MSIKHVVTHNTGNTAAKALAALIAEKQGKPCTVKYPWHAGDENWLVNWGASSSLDSDAFIMNAPEAVRRAVDKRLTMAGLKLAGVQTVPWTTQKKVAQQWWDEDKVVMCRTKIQGARGEGLVVAGKRFDTPIVRSKLYTRFIKPEREIRILSYAPLSDNVMLVKRSKKDVKANFWIRSHGNGWVYCKPREEEMEDLFPEAAAVAMDALMSLELYYGAVDICIQRKGNGQHVFRVLEVNSAPAIECTASREWLGRLATRITVESGSFLIA